MKKVSFDLNLTTKRTVLSRSCSSFCYYRRADGTRGVNFQMLTPQSKVNYEINEVFPGNTAVAVVTKSVDRRLLKKNGFVSSVNKSCYIQDHFFLTVYEVLKQVRAWQREFGADNVKISTIFHWTEL